MLYSAVSTVWYDELQNWSTGFGLVHLKQMTTLLHISHLKFFFFYDLSTMLYSAVSTVWYDELQNWSTGFGLVHLKQMTTLLHISRLKFFFFYQDTASIFVFFLLYRPIHIYDIKPEIYDKHKEKITSRSNV